jgi:hypothetical protein
MARLLSAEVGVQVPGDAPSFCRWLAQLVRAAALQAVGSRFESVAVYQVFDVEKSTVHVRQSRGLESTNVVRPKGINESKSLVDCDGVAAGPYKPSA